MSIEVENETTFDIPEREFVDLARYVFEAMHLHPATELEIRFVDEKPMEELHIKWMDEPGATDVLSFPMDELVPGTVENPTEAGMLGSIVICPAFAERQALKAGHSAEEEMLLLATHGILHLLGYDHVEVEEEKVMFALQRKLLLTFLSQRGEA